MSKDISGIVAWLKNWFYDKTEINGFITTLNNSINSKLNKNLTEANKQLVTDGSGQVVLANKPTVPINTSDLVNDGESGVDTYVEMGDLSNVATSGSYNDLTNKPTIPDVTNLIDTAGTGLSKTGTTLNHSNSVTAQSSAVFKKITYDGQGHITGTANVGSSDLPSHTHEAIDVVDVDFIAYTNINPSNDRQSDINSAIDTAIGNLQSIKAIEVVSTLPTASSLTMGKLYIISENSKVNVYYTQQSGSSYSWHKMDADILDELSIDWSEIENNPFNSSTPSSFANASHTHGEITNDGKIGNSANKVIITGTGGSLTAVSTIGATNVADVNAHNNIGSSASANQGAINTAIDTAIGNKQGKIYFITTTPAFSDYNEGDVVISSQTNLLYYVSDDGFVLFPNAVAVNSLLSGKANKNHASTGTTYGVGTTSNYGHNKIIDNLTSSTLVNGESLSAHQGYVLKGLIDDLEGDRVTSIALVPYSEDQTGAIRLYYGDEPSS